MNTVVSEVNAKNAVELRYVNTIVSEVHAETAVELGYVDTIVSEVNARNAVELQYVNIVVSEAYAKNAEGLRFVNTVVSEVDARNAVELQYVNTVVGEVDAKNAKELQNGGITWTNWLSCTGNWMNTCPTCKRNTIKQWTRPALLPETNDEVISFKIGRSTTNVDQPKSCSDSVANRKNV